MTKSNKVSDDLRRPKESLSEVFRACEKSQDFVRHTLTTQYEQTFTYTFFETMVDGQLFKEQILPVLQKGSFSTLRDVKSLIPIEDTEISADPIEIEKRLISGYIFIQFEKADPYGLLLRAPSVERRAVTVPEVEYSVLGPKESFVENLDVNLHLLRRRLKIAELTVENITVGSLTNTRVSVLYLSHIANSENVNTVLQRIRDIDYDEIIDSSYINQMIEDNKHSPFPQLLDTERPDRVASELSRGKVAVLVDGSPTAITTPTRFIEFFSAFEDYYLSWHIASIYRLIRLFAVLFSIFATSLYVAVLTYHTELIPMDLLSTLVISREDIPFPPIIEALFLELTIDLLREAGARLPSKVGQTIGIVGGIVIGTAAVEASLTSNILLIVVALSALASFATPIYRIGNTIRLIRFPFLIFAQIWGIIGITILSMFMIIHLLTLKSIGRPYLEPIFPPRSNDLRDAFFRLPFSLQFKRSTYVQPEHGKRFSIRELLNKNEDIDEHID
ncbi:spore germination protein [Texcoconibacillus texcoconensis]|uniref:Spore germination protein n=1 Tax=Texcoconibacillus texcoconensis TaxID=1095777 RepID=A0A840QT38_9BACI|nr:hypothetical protein [Texcoconibacillus texcoconensis]